MSASCSSMPWSCHVRSRRGDVAVGAGEGAGRGGVADPRRHQPEGAEGCEAERPGDVGRGHHGRGVHPGRIRGRPSRAGQCHPPPPTWKTRGVLATSTTPLCRGLRPGDARPRRRRLHRGRRGPRRGRAPAPRPRGRHAGAPSSPTTPRAAPQTVADHLGDLGVEADVADVVTSAQAAARVLERATRAGSPGRAARWPRARGGPRRARPGAGRGRGRGGGPGHRLRPRGPVERRSCGPRSAIREGLWWVASNTDMTIPTPFGVAPGHGVLVDTLRRFAEVEPVVAGKPARPLLDETVRRVGGERPLMVGDRLDTDIEGARNAGRRLAAGAHRRDRAERAGRRRARRSGRRTSGPTWRRCGTAHRAPEAEACGLVAGRLARRGARRIACAVDGRRRGRRLVAGRGGGGLDAGSTSTGTPADIGAVHVPASR